jgi:hypothetical protein
MKTTPETITERLNNLGKDIFENVNTTGPAHKSIQMIINEHIKQVQREADEDQVLEKVAKN